MRWTEGSRLPLRSCCAGETLRVEVTRTGGGLSRPAKNLIPHLVYSFREALLEEDDERYIATSAGKEKIVRLDGPRIWTPAPGQLSIDGGDTTSGTLDNVELFGWVSDERPTWVPTMTFHNLQNTDTAIEIPEHATSFTVETGKVAVNLTITTTTGFAFTVSTDGWQPVRCHGWAGGTLVNASATPVVALAFELGSFFTTSSPRGRRGR